jgi:molecular chaperone Hsp33
VTLAACVYGAALALKGAAQLSIWRSCPILLGMSEETPLTADVVRRFIVENRPVRGHWVRLDAAWRELCAHSDYPEPVRDLLGQAVAASVLFAATLKFHGTLTLQLQGDGAISLLVAQCTHDFRLRAVARFDEQKVDAAVAEYPGSQGARPAISQTRSEGARRRAGADDDAQTDDAELFRELVGTTGRVAVTIEADERNMRYQGVVPLHGGSLADSLEEYFASSEQLPTRLILAADGERGAGFLVQKVPGPTNADESELEETWQDAQRGIEKLSEADLLACPVEELLERGFAEHDMRLFRGTPVQFQCRCNQGRVAGLLRALGAEEVRDILKEQGSVTVTCEFCHRPYRFDAVDVDALFSESSTAGGSPSIH